MTVRFEGTDSYVATEDLMMAVNAAVTLGRPLLVKGEPGTGKTQLAQEVAEALQRPLLQWHIKSTTKARHGLYEYDAVARLRDSQLGDPRVADVRNYIIKGQLWNAFESLQLYAPPRTVVRLPLCTCSQTLPFMSKIPAPKLLLHPGKEPVGISLNLYWSTGP